MEAISTSTDFQQHLSNHIPLFVANVEKTMLLEGMDVSTFFLDHCCYRTESTLQYSHLKLLLLRISVLLVESEIGSRPIATFKLNNPIICKHLNRYRSINIIELASPKLKSYYPSGLEHVEFVINPTCLLDFKNKYLHMKWNLKGMSKDINPDLRLDFDGFSVKFHSDSLEVI
jgi:predicted metalloenzyme YecM